MALKSTQAHPLGGRENLREEAPLRPKHFGGLLFFGLFLLLSRSLDGYRLRLLGLFGG